MPQRDALAFVVFLAIAIAPALAPGARAGDPRLLPFEPLADAVQGEHATYAIEVLDARGERASTSERTYTVDRVEDHEVAIGRIRLETGADAREIIEAMRLLPPGTPTAGLKAAAASEKRGDGAEREVVKVTLETAISSASMKVVFEARFAKDAPVFGLLSARTRILGGGAGESVYTLREGK
jgi:hypothetical protein